MTPDIEIWGAGLAGLIAARMCALAGAIAAIREKQPTLPNNHHALLRFRSETVSLATGIPFRKVYVTKAVAGPWGPLAAANLYSRKVTGTFTGRSIMNLEPGERWIAPLDFINQIHTELPWPILYDSPVTEQDLFHQPTRVPVISTIPMPVMMDLMGWARPLDFFRFHPIYTTTAKVISPVVDLYQTLYLPDPEVPWYRISVTGNTIIAESREPSDKYELLREMLAEHFGFYPVDLETETFTQHVQAYGKIVPVPTVHEEERRSFILTLTDKRNIYSLGRFATWRQLVLDDLVTDVQFILKLIRERSIYSQRLGSRT